MSLNDRIEATVISQSPDGAQWREQGMYTVRTSRNPAGQEVFTFETQLCSSLAVAGLLCGWDGVWCSEAMPTVRWTTAVAQPLLPVHGQHICMDQVYPHHRRP